ncbi:MAG: hypothetical protein M3R50_02095 [Bacteroidota bacterium]|nr:hypothetical protein [Bacteroidota bacterium]
MGDNNKQAVSFQFGNQLTTLGSEENQLPAYFKHHPVRISSTSRNYSCDENFYSYTSQLPVKKHSVSPITNPYFLTKPEYYIFLFRYTLF